jgi:hypothetical protein
MKCERKTNGVKVISLLYFLQVFLLMFLCISCETDIQKPSIESEPEPEIEQEDGKIDGYGYVDLGLSVKWATYNVGASKPEELGEYFRWGETNPYSTNKYEYTKNPCSSDGILSSKNDAVSSNWSKSWRMPTKSEFKELKDNCKWIWTDDYNESGLSGYIITSNKNGKSIFLPAGAYYKKGTTTLSSKGEGYYWSSESLGGDVTKSQTATDFVIKSNRYQMLDVLDKSSGLQVRGVVGSSTSSNADEYDLKESGKVDGYGYVDLGLSVKWATYNVGASKLDELGKYYRWGETNPYSTNAYDYTYNPCSSDGILSWKYDAVSSNWSKSWRMPTKSEFQELKDNCNWKWIVDYNESGLSGYIVTSKKNGKSIFLPAGAYYKKGTTTLSSKGEGYYWSSEISTGQVSGSQTAADFVIKSNNYKLVNVIDKSSGLQVRGVVGPSNDFVPDVYEMKESGKVGGHGYVDLGLSVKWATCNLGATKAWDFGDYYAWGTTVPHSNSIVLNYKYYDNICSPDNILSSKYDAVTVNWGRSWRMPTYEEQEELMNNCEWRWSDNINKTGIPGYVVTSKKNGNSIFLPAGKYKPHESYMTATKIEGHYWSSWSGVGSVTTTKSAMGLFFMSGIVDTDFMIKSDGLLIRGVVGTPNDYIPVEDFTIDEKETQRQGFTVSGKIGNYTYVDLGLPSRTLWATYNVGATLPAEYGNFYAWGETEPQSYYSPETYKFYAGVKNNWNQYSKYVLFNSTGKVDNKTRLEPIDDAATVNWGSNWCMPTKEQITELAEYCDFYERNVLLNGQYIRGYVGISKINEFEIFIPSAGWSYKTYDVTRLTEWYWSSDLSYDEISGATDYRAFYMTYDPYSGSMIVLDTSRCQGLSVRPVVKK